MFLQYAACFCVCAFVHSYMYMRTCVLREHTCLHYVYVCVPDACVRTYVRVNKCVHVCVYACVSVCGVCVWGLASMQLFID